MKDIIQKLSDLEYKKTDVIAEDVPVVDNLKKPPLTLEQKLLESMADELEEQFMPKTRGFFRGLAGALTAPLGQKGAMFSAGYASGQGAANENRLLQYMIKEGMLRYMAFYNNLKASQGTDPTPDQVLDWAKNLYKNDRFEFPTPPRDGKPNTVSAWLMQQIQSNRATLAANPPTPPTPPEEFLTWPKAPVTITGTSSGKTYSYDPAQPNQWTDNTGKVYTLPNDAAIIKTLNSRPESQQAGTLTSVANPPKSGTRLRLTDGRHWVYGKWHGTPIAYATWHQYDPATNAPITSLDQTDPAQTTLVNQLNQLAARP
jgi:hypothetical protein